ncbi:AMP-binding protein [Frankia sp. AgB32]|nr:AMP-binding protein [Frankia sp. AgB32]
MYASSEAPSFSGSLPSDNRERRLSDDGAIAPGGEVRTSSSGHPREGPLRGSSVALGYLDPADDLAAFEGGWYRSGDQVEVHEGRLTVVGRIKEVVNRNGLKISLSEIDTRVTLDDVVARLLAQGMAKRELPEQLVRWDGPLPRTTSGKIVRSRLVMESPTRDGDLARRLRDH